MSHGFGLQTDKDVVRRILANHALPKPVSCTHLGSSRDLVDSGEQGHMILKTLPTP
jgi:hypothetical protein